MGAPLGPAPGSLGPGSKGLATSHPVGLEERAQAAQACPPAGPSLAAAPPIHEAGLKRAGRVCARLKGARPKGARLKGRRCKGPRLKGAQLQGARVAPPAHGAGRRAQGLQSRDDAASLQTCGGWGSGGSAGASPCQA